MANRNLFGSAVRVMPESDTLNRAGGRAYKLSAKAALAQMAMTGTLADTYYASASDQLADVKAYAQEVDAEFLAKLAVYARQDGYMKDLPAFLCAVVAARDVTLLSKIFDRVIDNGKMLRNFVQIVRSGAAGRKSLGTRPKKLVAAWLNAANDSHLLAASVGNSPSLADVVRLSHAKGRDESRDAFFKYLLTGNVGEALPQVVRDLADFREGLGVEIPRVPFELLTSLDLSEANWAQIARNATWTQTRMNLNTFMRHGVFESREMVDVVAARLRDPAEVRKARAFPYQLLAAYLFAGYDVPTKLKNALQDAMEVAVENVPDFGMDTAVLVDVSGSMKDPVTGKGSANPSKIRCVDAAALFASAILRKNEDAVVVPFQRMVREVTLNPRDSVVSNTQKLSALLGGGTACSVALAELNRRGSRAQLVIYVSDNESWAESGRCGQTATPTMGEWREYKRRNPKAKLVCIDITPNTTTQAKESTDVLNIGGFSDNVFKVIAQFAKGQLGGEHWVAEIEKVEL
ncbi:TROVE domain-containing protein [Paraburkholderia sp. UCT31]|uniref:RNA-binding protein n=1 Tax=Paraburkholderia sp. UCT31 TaxID=2615209 RepID=UPI0016554030|nr:RNA-binding protein [Paraburkholderia sp. UCT31]MBC8737006.1 TROVE domain-containing protein [Paraburkholderia sp. UCT31]